MMYAIKVERFDRGGRSFGCSYPGSMTKEQAIAWAENERLITAAAHCKVTLRPTGVNDDSQDEEIVVDS